MNLDFIFFLPGLVIGLTVHEFSHALTAAWLGDRCAASQGRISLNPFRHLSFWGTLALFVLGFGWGKPVPVNLYNFRHPKRDFLLTSLAGPAANLLLCAVSLGLVYLNFPWWLDSQLRMIFLINAMLAIFNLLPIPPLDGSRIWPCVIPGMKPAATGRLSLIWMIVLVYIMMTGKIGIVIEPVIQSAIQLLPHRHSISRPRPDGFPLELVAPQEAQALYWALPVETADPNQFIMSFSTEETFPPDQLMTFLRGNLQRQNWTRCDWDPEDPNQPVQTEWRQETNEDGLPYYLWSEMWFKPNRGLFAMEVTHYMDDPHNPSEPSEVSVDVTMLTPANDEYKKFFREYQLLEPDRLP